MERSVVEKCWRRVLEKSVGGESCRVVEQCGRRELERSVVEKCWRRVLQRSVGEGCCREVL